MKLSLLRVIQQVVLAAIWVGCASEPPEEKPPPPAQPQPAVVAPGGPTATRVELDISADLKLNPDAHGRQSPVVFRIYQLKTPLRFTTSDFFALYQKDQQVLEGDLLQKDEFLLRPGENRRFSFEVKPEAQSIGALAAFHNLETARWRLVMPLLAHQHNQFSIGLSNNQLIIQK